MAFNFCVDCRASGDLFRKYAEVSLTLREHLQEEEARALPHAGEPGDQDREAEQPAHRDDARARAGGATLLRGALGPTPTPQPFNPCHLDTEGKRIACRTHLV